MQNKNTSLWIVSREYAGIAEAGGVKNVVCSLSEELVRNNFDVTVFIPLYGCTQLSSVKNFTADISVFTTVEIDQKKYEIVYAHAELNGVKIIFVIHAIFANKKAVYVYTESEEKENPSHIRGCGHQDAAIMNMLFQKAVLYYGANSNQIPDIIHCQDATTAMIPVFGRKDTNCNKVFLKTSFIVTIHNAGPGYHHAFPSIDEAIRLTSLPCDVLTTGLLDSRIEPFLIAQQYAVLTTVSPWYADEIIDKNNKNTDGLSKIFANRKCKIYGITNGIDFNRYDPRNTESSLLSEVYNPLVGDLSGKKIMREKFKKDFSILHRDIIGVRKEFDDTMTQFGTFSNNGPSIIFAYHGRIVHQKGLSVLVGAAKILLEKYEWAKFIIVGQGVSEIESQQIEFSKKYPGRFLFFRGYNRSFTRLCTAVADFIVLPSFFEPCGLEDFIAQILGTIPVAHATGGLKKIEDGKTGFLYNNNDPETLANLLAKLGMKKLEDDASFDDCIINGANSTHDKYSWTSVVKNHYIPLYQKVLKKT